MAVKHKCPVCGKFDFEGYNCFDDCEVCGWIDDAVQVNEPDLEGGANKMSLNQAKEAYAEGRRVF